MMSPRTRSRVLMLVTGAALIVNVALLAGPSMLADLLPGAAQASTNGTPKKTVQAKSKTAERKVSDEGRVKEPPSSAAATDPARTAGTPTSSAGADATAAAPSVSSSSGSKDEAKATKPPDGPSAPSSKHGKDGESGATGDDPDGSAALDPAVVAEAEKTFRRIVQAYENMEPANASAALVRLAERDLPSTVKTLMAMNPRKTGAVLDAMSAKSPETAAMITDEMIALAMPSSLSPAR